jgi:hypothetical protein
VHLAAFSHKPYDAFGSKSFILLRVYYYFGATYKYLLHDK